MKRRLTASILFLLLPIVMFAGGVHAVSASTSPFPIEGAMGESAYQAPICYDICEKAGIRCSRGGGHLYDQLDKRDVGGELADTAAQPIIGLECNKTAAMGVKFGIVTFGQRLLSTGNGCFNRFAGQLQQCFFLFLVHKHPQLVQQFYCHKAANQ